MSTFIVAVQSVILEYRKLAVSADTQEEAEDKALGEAETLLNAGDLADATAFIGSIVHSCEVAP